MRRFVSGLFACALLLSPFSLAAASAASTGPAHVDASYLGNLQWRMIGPFRGGRDLAVSGVPGQPDHFYFGSVDGGVWESVNAGRTWNPIFDGQPVASIGALAIAPSDPMTIYVGTGEADMRSDIAYGNGIYKSTDGGKTWQHLGLDDTRQIGSIVVDPHDANIAYVAALGHQYGPNAERGVFKTIDGGKTWSKVLFKNNDTGAIELALDPSNSKTIYAALWQVRRPPWNVYPPASGPGSGLYKSIDAGATWTQLTNGLPMQVGRIGLSISAANPQRVYAMVDALPADKGGVYRSDDAGATWTHLNGEPRLWTRGWYFGHLTVDPKNADVVYVMNTSVYRSNDAGKSFVAVRGDPTGDDYHTLWIDPNDSNRMVLGSDQGTVVTVDGAKTWSSWLNQPTGQFYHVVTDNRFPYWVYGAQQDSGADMEPSRSKYAEISNFDFHPIDAGGESGYIAPDPLDPSMTFGGTVTAERTETGWEQTRDPQLAYPETTWRQTWTLPLVFSPADPHSLYFGYQRVFRSRDRGHSWQIVSPDLSRANEGTPANLDAPTRALDNGISRHGVVYAIAPSPLSAALIWAGTDDGLIWVTRDGGQHWQNVTPPQLTSWSKVGILEASHFDPLVAYAAIDRHRLDDLRPYIYRTADGGKTWTPIVEGIPDGSFVNVVREDPHQRNLLYAGTERGMYFSADAGSHWHSLQLNLPVTSIRDIAFQGNDVAIATHGRAFWVLDDVSSLRQLADAVEAGGDYFFTPANAVRTRPGNDEETFLQPDEPQTPNPPNGAYFDYYLDGSPRTPVSIEIVSRDGRAMRSWSSASPPKPVDPTTLDFVPSWAPAQAVPTARAGAQRFVWDFHTKDGRGPLAPPGTYSIRLSVNGKTLTRPLTLRRDPRVAATDADLEAQYQLARAIDVLLKTVAQTSTLAKSKLGKLTGTAAQTFDAEIVGLPPGFTPDELAPYSNDHTSLRYIASQLRNLEDAVESADAAPTADMQLAFHKLAAIYAKTVARMSELTR
ncbi:MAG: hypothetical protein JO199_14080 [Candidatus Eremiobacteraeota bacterium]|nr:hypothetical protein [Candidatus Eremiobacteraeota bacterium]